MNPIRKIVTLPVNGESETARRKKMQNSPSQMILSASDHLKA